MNMKTWRIRWANFEIEYEYPTNDEAVDIWNILAVLVALASLALQWIQM